MHKPRAAELLTAPLLLLEQTKGWKRRALASFYQVIALLMGAYAWHSLCLWRLPNAPEPFDLARYGRIEVSDGDNAMWAYRDVLAKFGDFRLVDYKMSDWSVADAETRRWTEEHREALEAWLPANDRLDSLLLQPEALRMRSDQEPLQRIRPYVRLALLEASRLEESGDLAGAWRMYRAVLRASRHTGQHGGAIQRPMGSGLLKQSRPRIEAWIASPGMTVELLRRAISDIEECRAMTSPASEMVRAEYFSALYAVNDMDRWWQLSETGAYTESPGSLTYHGRTPPRWIRPMAAPRLPIAPHLSDDEIARRYRGCREAREKIYWQALWLLTRPESPPSPARVAEVLGLSAGWIRALVKRGNADGPACLADRRTLSNGGQSKLTPERRSELHSALGLPPPDGGLWTGPKVAASARPRWGVAVCKQTGWEWIRGLGLAPQVPRPRNPKAATAEEQRAWKRRHGPVDSRAAPAASR